MCVCACIGLCKVHMTCMYVCKIYRSILGPGPWVWNYMGADPDPNIFKSPLVDGNADPEIKL